LKSQEQDLSPPEVEIKQEAGYEFWSEKEEWFPRIQKHTACTKKQIMDKLSKEYSLTEPSAAPSHPVDPESQWSTPIGEPNYMENLAPSAEVQTYNAPLNQQFTAQQNVFHNPQATLYGWPQPPSELMHVDSISENHPNMSRMGARNHSMPSLAPAAALETRVSVNSNYNVIDPRLLSKSQNIYGTQFPPHYIYDTNSVSSF
jgi:hypothetical protein